MAERETGYGLPMSSSDDERVLRTMERDLTADHGVRTALDVFNGSERDEVSDGSDGRDVGWPRRTTVVTLLGVVTLLAVVGTGNAMSWLGGLVLTVAAVAVVDARRSERRAAR